MTKVMIEPGICGFVTSVEAVSEDQQEVKIKVKSGCKSVKKMIDDLGDTYDAFEVCLVKPGKNAFYDYASENFPVHAGCPVIAGIVKCIEAECYLALKKDASIKFIEE